MREKLAKTRLEDSSLEVKKSPVASESRGNKFVIPPYLQKTKQKLGRNHSRSSLGLGNQEYSDEVDRQQMQEANSMISRKIRLDESAFDQRRGGSVVEDHKTIDTTKTPYKPLFKPASNVKDNVSTVSAQTKEKERTPVKLPSINAPRQNSVQPKTVKPTKVPQQLPKQPLPKTQS